MIKFKALTECNLGKFFGIITKPPETSLDINWELNTPIYLPYDGKYTLKYFTYYNCYEKLPILPFYKGCTFVYLFFVVVDNN